MQQIILQKLKEVEQTRQVKILFACESGSRAWGFPSPDSDYDVRFIYVHSKDYYLSIDERSDVIELPLDDVLDINGWELRKALRLFKKSNAAIYEWLLSPIIYRKNDEFHEHLVSLMPEYFSARSMMHHHLAMAKGVFQSELGGDEVRLKKYFYALRPVLACQWILAHNEAPPVAFSNLHAQLNGALANVVEDLLRQKVDADEKFKIKKITPLNDFISMQMQQCEQAIPERRAHPVDTQPLNELFRKFML